MNKMKCPICNRRIFDVSNFPESKIEIAIKCQHCGRLVTINCGKSIESEISEEPIHKQVPQDLVLNTSSKAADLKEKIARIAVDVFMKNGFSETSMQEIADAVGMEKSSVHRHFDSKSDILDYILEFYSKETTWVSAAAFEGLTKDSGTDDVIACMYLYFPKNKERYYIKTLHVLVQEHYRNSDIREFVARTILWQETYVAEVLKRLISVGALNKSIDIDFWAKLHVSITVIFVERLVIGIGEMYPQFEGKGMEAMLRTMYDLVFKLHGKKEVSNDYS